MSKLRTPAIALAILPTVALCQVGRLEPPAPHAAARVQISYRPTHADARLPKGETVFASLRIMTPSGAVEQPLALRPNPRGTLVGALRLPKDALHLKVVFATRWAVDKPASFSSMVRDSAGQPVRGARVHEAWEQRSRCLEIVAEERRRFPESYAALRRKWAYNRLFRAGRYSAEELSRDLALVSDKKTPGALLARVYLSIMRGERKTARDAVLSALRDHPTAWATAQAVRDFGTRDNEVRRALYEVLKRHPGRWISRMALLSEWDQLPFDQVREVVVRWLRDEPTNPLPHLYLATASMRCRQSLAEGASSAHQAINGFLKGDGRIASSETRGLEEAYLPWSWLVAAEIAAKRGDVASAIGFAQAHSQYTGMENGDELEARVWEQIHDLERARKCWLRAHSKGSSGAKEQLARLWKTSAPDSDGFEAWMNKELAKLRSRIKSPSFQCKDLKGKVASLESLRGKVVVLNFWKLSCPPCKQEIPSLNKLVGAYRDKPVEFLAFSPDDAAEVVEFMRKSPFAYRQIVSNKNLYQAFGFSSVPAHVVLDSDGRIIAQFTGSSPAHPRKLGKLIDTALAEIREG